MCISHVLRKMIIFLYFNSLIISLLFKKHRAVHIIYIYTYLSKSQFLVFNSEKRHMKTYGFTTNWNSSGYIELIHLVRKYNLKVFFERRSVIT